MEGEGSELQARGWAGSVAVRCRQAHSWAGLVLQGPGARGHCWQVRSCGCGWEGMRGTKKSKARWKEGVVLNRHACSPDTWAVVLAGSTRAALVLCVHVHVLAGWGVGCGLGVGVGLWGSLHLLLH